MKFDLFNFFLNEAAADEEDLQNNTQLPPGNNLQNNPNPQGQNMGPADGSADNTSGEEGSPEQQTQQVAASEDIFSDERGKTVKNIEFEHVGTNSGQVKIYFQEYSNVPLVISWTNDKVTVTKPPGGDIYPLT